MSEFEYISEKLDDFCKSVKGNKFVEVSETETNLDEDRLITVTVKDKSSDEFFEVYAGEFVVGDESEFSCYIEFNDTIGDSKSFAWGDLIAFLNGIEFDYKIPVKSTSIYNKYFNCIYEMDTKVFEKILDDLKKNAKTLRESQK